MLICGCICAPLTGTFPSLSRHHKHQIVKDNFMTERYKTSVVLDYISINCWQTLTALLVVCVCTEWHGRVYDTSWKIRHAWNLHTHTHTYNTYIQGTWKINECATVSYVSKKIYTVTGAALGTRNFAIAGAKTWNNLPVDLRLHSQSLLTFRQRLKRYLFVCCERIWGYLVRAI